LNEGGQWKDIQKYPDTFNWTTIDQAYRSSIENNFIFSWNFSIIPSKYPDWSEKLPQLEIENRLINLFSIICERYEKVDQFIVEVDD